MVFQNASGDESIRFFNRSVTNPAADLSLFDEPAAARKASR